VANFPFHSLIKDIFSSLLSPNNTDITSGLTQRNSLSTKFTHSGVLSYREDCHAHIHQAIYPIKPSKPGRSEKVTAEVEWSQMVGHC